MENNKSMLQKANQYIGAMGDINRSDVKEFASVLKEMAEKNNHAIVAESSLQIELPNPEKDNKIKYQDVSDFYAGTNERGNELFYVPMNVIMNGKEETRLYDIVIACLDYNGEKRMYGYSLMPASNENKLAASEEGHVYNIHNDLSRDILITYTKLVAKTCNIILDQDLNEHVELLNILLTSIIANLKESGKLDDDGVPYSMGYECIDTAVTYIRNDKKYKFVIIVNNDLHIIQLIGVPYNEYTDNIKSFNLAEIYVTKENVEDENLYFKIESRLDSILRLANYTPYYDKTLYDITKDVAIKLHDKLKSKFIQREDD